MKIKKVKLMKKVLVYGLIGTLLAGSTLTAHAAGLKDIFDATRYSQYNDLREAFGDDEEALYNHYKEFGFNENRVMNDLIDVKRYRERYADLDAAFGDNWDAYVDHYITYGFKEGREAFGKFDARYYFDRYADLREAFGEDALALYIHYMNYGRAEGRACAAPAPAPATNYGSNNNSQQPGTDDNQQSAPVAFSGRIVDPETGEPVPNAVVRFFPHASAPETGVQPAVRTASDNDASVSDNDFSVSEGDNVTTTDENGNYTLNVMPGSYRVEVSARGYLVLTMDTVIVNAGEASIAPTVTLLSENADGESAIAGRLTNALNGQAVEGVTVTLRGNWNNTIGTVVATTTTDANGEYYFDVERGYYTATYEKDGFVTKSQNVISVANYTSYVQNEALTPAVAADSYRIVLTWGETPRDLDSHITGPTLDGTTSFHVYYGNKRYYDGEGNDIVTLDHDDVTSYGPETVTVITPMDDAIYRYSVYNFSGETAMQFSNASVVVYAGDTQVATYNIPVVGEGRYWNVFDIVDGQIVTVNEFSSSSLSMYTENLFVQE